LVAAFPAAALEIEPGVDSETDGIKTTYGDPYTAIEHGMIRGLVTWPGDCSLGLAFERDVVTTYVDVTRGQDRSWELSLSWEWEFGS